MTKATRYIDGIIDDGASWYALRLFTLKLEEVRTYFTNLGLECFVPEQYVDVEGTDGKLHPILRPIVRNLLFIKQPKKDKSLQKLIQETNYKISIIKKHKESQELALIPHDQMYEFRLMCNPEISMRKFLSSEEAQMKAGDEVFVKFGPLKGMNGRLVRSSKKYYLLKEIPGLGVMLKISRWCCVPIEKK
jgi:putative updY